MHFGALRASADPLDLSVMALGDSMQIARRAEGTVPHRQPNVVALLAGTEDMRNNTEWTARPTGWGA